MSLDEMYRVLNLVSSLTEEMSISWYSTQISDRAIKESCRIHPFGFHSEVSCPDFLLAWEIAMEGKYNFEYASLGYEVEKTFINDINESCNLKGRRMTDFASPKDPKGANSWFKANDGDNKDHKYNVISFGSHFDSYITSLMLLFIYAHGVVYHEIRPLEGEIIMCECTPMVGDLLDQVISFHYPSQFDDLKFEYDAKGKKMCL
jgi:hypothetical protein